MGEKTHAFTVRLHPDLAHAIRIVAAYRNQSLSQFVGGVMTAAVMREATRFEITLKYQPPTPTEGREESE